MESRPDSDSSSLKGKRDGSGVNLTALWPVVLEQIGKADGQKLETD